MNPDSRFVVIVETRAVPPARSRSIRLTGALTAGTEYRMFVSFRLEDTFFDFSGSEANGTGSVSLGLSAVPVPEPSTASLLVVGLALLAAARRP